MTTALTKYENALKLAFTQVYGGSKADWSVGEEKLDAEGQTMREFKNEKSGILLQVTGQEQDGCGKFSAKRAGSDDAFNMSIPQSWING